MDEFFDMIVRPASDTPLPENKEDHDSLLEYAGALKLYSVKSTSPRDFEKKIDGKVYQLNNNPMGITKISFSFTDGVCKMDYTNIQGDKTLYFRINENEFGIFPEEGYSDEVGSQFAPGHYLRCAASAA